MGLHDLYKPITLPEKEESYLKIELRVHLTEFFRLKNNKIQLASAFQSKGKPDILFFTTIQCSIISWLVYHRITTIKLLN